MHLNPLTLVFALCLVDTISQSIEAVTSANTVGVPRGFQSRSINVANHDSSGGGHSGTNLGGDEEFDHQAQTHLAYKQYQLPQTQQQQLQQPLYDYSQSEEEEQEESPKVATLYQGRQTQTQTQSQTQQQYQQHQHQHSNYLTINGGSSNNKKPLPDSIETDEEEEEPDRLSLLLAKSKFQCTNRNSGYYADESLQCEVFHYCQDNQKHSWICPEGFTFHQIHLICMPPSSENICQQSSKYHIVNDYLYKPLNLQEHQSKPNVTLKYSERYYPEHYYDHDRYSEEDETPRPHKQYQQKQPIQVGFQEQIKVLSHQRGVGSSQQQQQQSQQKQQQQQQQQQQPDTNRHQMPTISQTPVYRRPSHSTTPQPQLQHARPHVPAVAITPTPYRLFTAHPELQYLQQQQQQVYRTPEEINISLQQRRPQYFLGSTTPRYYEDEYLYERK